MIQRLRMRIALLVLFVLFLATLTFSQQKERNRKSDAAQKAAAAASDPSAKDDKNEGDPLFRGMKYRSIGPYRGGRSLTAAGIPGDPTTYYFGSTGGGVWKSTDGANTWSPVFDKDGAPSIGSIAVAVSDPNTVYVGTGEACIRGNISQGDGVWKSVDAGKSWKSIGLKESRAIGKVIVNPHNPDIVFVAALGHPFGPNTERGVFRTTDGGKTWDKVLYKDENTGAIDVAFDPQNPNILFASLWETRRTPWTLSSGGPGSGVYRSTDGGSTWKRLDEHGLPNGPYGRVGLAVAANSERVYALIEAKAGGLYRSDDGGDTWDLVNGSHGLLQRPWYYMHVIADPQDANTLYVADVEFFKSTDGGHNFNKIKVPHGDNHGLWIDPKNTKRMIASDDGGVTVSLDGGKSWTREDNQPTAQFYHVITDTRTPYYVYGSQQDNSTVAISSRSDDGAIGRDNWYEVGGGEAGYIAPNPADPNIVYAGDYQGNITRFDRRTNQVKSIAVWPELSDARGAAPLEHRFQWTAPIVTSPFDPNTIYYGGERIFKTSDGGMHWEAISGDLTRNDKSKQQPSGGAVTIDDTGTEYYDTVFSIAPSPLAKGLIWAGTDDGLIQITRDEGKSWTNVTPKNVDLAEWSRISLIEASPHDAGTAYVAIDRHQNDDLAPYIYKTIDYGANWSRITNGIPDGVFVRAVREDPKRKGLLYAGTERGVFVSFDDGAHWRSLQINLPITPVHDLVIKNDDLVLATHGRAFWILDDVSPLRQFADAVANEDTHLYQPATAYRVHTGEAPTHFSFAGKNPPTGAVIYFYLKQAPKQEVKIEILDAAGNVIRKYSSSKTEPLDEPLDPDDKKPEKQIKLEDGLNRFVWDLRYEEANRVPGYFLWEYNDGAKGPLAVPGNYQVRLTANGKSLMAPFEVKIDPRVTTSQSDLEKQFKLQMDVREQLNRVYYAVNQIQDVREQLDGLKKRLVPGDSMKALFDGASALDAKLIAVRDPLINFRISASEDSLAYAPGIDAKLAFLSMAVAGFADSAPTEAQYQEFDKLKKQTDELLARWDQVRNADITSFQKLAAEQNVHSIYVPDVRSERVQGGGEEE
jgi:photosystem II stability/assembly factor-like uncharacterized protein